MSGTDWALYLGLPASILAAAAIAVAIIRWHATSTVFWVLKNHPQRWLALSKEVGVFSNLFAGADLAGRLELENERLHTMIVEKLTPLATIPVEVAKLHAGMEHFGGQVERLAKAVEDMPARIAVLEERSRTHIDTPPNARKGRP